MASDGPRGVWRGFLLPSLAACSSPIPALHGVVRWRLIDLCQWIFAEVRITVSPQTLSRELRKMGFCKLSARPRHHAQANGAIEDFKKVSPPAFGIPFRVTLSESWHYTLRVSIIFFRPTMTSRYSSPSLRSRKTLRR
jgi:hypothetical protein